MEPDCVLGKHDILVLPDSHQTAEIIASLSAVVQSLFPSIYTQTVLFTARVDVQIAVERIQLFDVHVIDKPHLPHAVLITGLLEILVPTGRQRVRDVRTKMWRDGRLVLVKPVLNTENSRCCAS